MNKLETKQLLKKLKNKVPLGENIDMVAQSRAVLTEIDLVKTTVWGLLSKDFLEKKNISEILAFIEFLGNKLAFSDLEKDFENLSKKLDGIFNQTDGITLENLLTETFSKNNPDKTVISIKKCSSEIDSEYKSDILTNFRYKGTKYKLGTQLTTLDSGEIISSKLKTVAEINSKIDKQKDWDCKKMFELDSVILVQLNGGFSNYIGRGKNILKTAITKRQNNGFNGDLIDYIENLDFVVELLRFCELYPFVINNYFKTINIDINKTGFTNKTIIAQTGEKIKVHYTRNEGKIEFDTYDEENLLFKIVFYINGKILQKMYPNL